MNHFRTALTLAACLLLTAPSAFAGKHAADAAKAPAPAAAAPAAEAAPEPESNEKISLASYQCKDILRLSGDERDIALGFMHGYFLGKKGVTEYVANALGKASDDFVEHCLDHPTDNALDTMAKFLK